MGDDVAGHLDVHSQPPAVFRYAESYLQLADPTPLSTMLPLRSEPFHGPSLREWIREPFDGPSLANWISGLMPDHDSVLARLLNTYSDRFRREPNVWGRF